MAYGFEAEVCGLFGCGLLLHNGVWLTPNPERARMCSWDEGELEEPSSIYARAEWR